jgi:PAS domain S-box-containing protein
MNAFDDSPYENLRLLAAQIPDNIMLLDREERIRFINWTVPDLTVEQVIGTQPYDYLLEEHRERARELYRGALAGRSGRLVLDYTSDDGNTSKFETRATPLLHRGRVEGVIAVSTNITERDEAVADRERFFAMSLDMLCVASTTGYFKRINPAFRKTLGWSEEELLARPFVDFVHPEDRERTLRAVERLSQGEEVLDFENRFAMSGGGYRTISWRATSLLSLGLLHAVGRDVTLHRDFERQLRQSQKMEAIGRLAGGVAHDFNNLLLAISANAELARERVTDPVTLEHMDLVLAGTRRAGELTRKLLTFGRGQPVHRRAVDVAALLRSLFKLTRRTFPVDVELDLTPPGELPAVWADEVLIEQSLLNLLINARDALPKGGRVQVDVAAVSFDAAECASQPSARVGRFVRITVRDNGVGIPHEIHQRIFEPFFTTKEPTHGTGLGLAMVYSIVEQHEGFIRVTSDVGIGTTFDLFLPVANHAAETTPRAARVDPIEASARTLLVAEDEPAVRRVVVRVLEKAGYRVLVAPNGEEAVDLAKQHPNIALALLDVIMPVMNGVQSAALIRREQPQIRIVLTSGYSDTNLAESGVDPSEILLKPYSPRDLLQRVRDELERGVAGT